MNMGPFRRGGKSSVQFYLFSTFSSSESSATSTGSGFIAKPENSSVKMEGSKMDLRLRLTFTCHCGGQELLDCPAGLG